MSINKKKNGKACYITEDMDFVKLINHPETMNRDTLYELRSLLAMYPYFQTVRLLLLQNLYLLHDPTFEEELKRSSIYLTDRTVAFNMIEAGHYTVGHAAKIAEQQDKTVMVEEVKASAEPVQDRTASIINQYLDTVPQEDTEKDSEPKHKKRKPTPADAAVDYVSYLMDTEDEEETDAQQQQTAMKGQNLIDNFINNENGKIELKEKPEYVPDLDSSDKKDSDESYFTETLAQIYIKQGRYSKALEIIKRLNLNYPKKNAYFADQIRFLEKLIINDKYKQGNKQP